MTSPTPLFRDGRYIRIWLIGWLTGVIRWLELLAYGLFALDLTGSPFLVAVLALIRFLPMAVLSLPIGAAADNLSPRKLLVVALSAVAVVMAIMLTAEYTGHLSYTLMILAALGSGIFWAADMPLRRKMIGEIAGPARLARAMSFDYATSNGTRMIGPLIGGIVYQGIGMSGIFAIGLALYIASLVLAIGIKPTGGKRGGAFNPRRTIIGALRAARRAVRDNDSLCILAVTVIFNIWGFPYVSMIPIIGKEILGLSPSVIGYIASIEGATGLIGVVLIGLFVGPRWYRRLYISGLAGCLATIAVMGSVSGTASLTLALAAAGLATACFAGLQATLIYVVAPKGMRGRYLGLISLCIGTGLIGFANVGLMAEWFGAQRALQIIAAEGAVALLVVLFGWRTLRIDMGLARRTANAS